ncbi:hypothetical protein SNE40_021405 [Patella caerulea]
MLVDAVPMTTRKSLKASSTSGDAVAFLGQLKRNEDSLVEQAKLLEKTDRVYLKQVLSTDIEGWTPFHAFVLRGARKLVKISLRCGVDANLRMGQPDNLPGGCSPLHLAAYRGDVSIIQLLIQYDADVNRKDFSNKTPVFYAATHNNTLAVKKLLKEGADISDIDTDQRQIYRNKNLRRSPALLCLKSTLL